MCQTKLVHIPCHFSVNIDSCVVMIRYIVLLRGLVTPHNNVRPTLCMDPEGTVSARLFKFVRFSYGDCAVRAAIDLRAVIKSTTQ
jgi:hypothetical protein